MAKHKPRFIKTYTKRDQAGRDETEICLNCTLPSCDDRNISCPLHQLKHHKGTPQ